MKLADLNDVGDMTYLKITDLENMFDIVEDDRLNNIFNLNKTLYVNVDKSKLSKFICDHDMQWPLISYRIYGTTRLAWLLWKLNDIDLPGTLATKHPGDEILYLPGKYADGIVASINEFDED